jgi:hypothetical protein
VAVVNEVTRNQPRCPEYKHCSLPNSFAICSLLVYNGLLFEGAL